MGPVAPYGLASEQPTAYRDSWEPCLDPNEAAASRFATDVQPKIPVQPIG